MRIHPVTLILLSFSLGCSLVSRHELKERENQRETATASAIEPSAEPPLIEESRVVEAEEILDEELPQAQVESVKQVSKSIHQIPFESNKDVQKWIEYFSQKDRARFQRFLDRGAKYREVVENVLKENGLPAELYYLAMIESGYQNHATSIAAAVGVWQFIPGTATRYGLEVSRTVDERRDPIRATEAAVRYLKDLHNVFGSWHLAMAGYNAGEYRVVRAVFKGKTRDFWKLNELKALPPETRNYIPKFLAAVEIGQNPLKYGFTTPLGERYPDLQAVKLANGLSLKEIAKTSGISFAELKKVNPHLTQGITPYGQDGYEVWVPLQLVSKVEKSKSTLALKAKTARNSNIASHHGADLHRVKPGENLSLIAKKYKMTILQLKKINGLKGSRIYVGSRLKVHGSKQAHMTRYKVRRGDNLTAIAQRFGMSVMNLKSINSIKNDRIFPGQILTVNM